MKRKAEMVPQNLKKDEENNNSDGSSQDSMQEDTSPAKNFKRKASIAHRLKNNRRPTIMIEEGTSLNDEFGDNIIETTPIDEEDEDFKAVSSQILIQPSVNELPNSSKEVEKPLEQKKWGIKLNLKLLASMELKVCCLERNNMVEIGEFSFYGEKDENRCFDLIPINQEDTKNFDDLLFVIECHQNDKKTIHKRYIHNVVDKYFELDETGYIKEMLEFSIFALL